MNSSHPLPRRVTAALALFTAPTAAQTELFHLQGASGEELGTALVATGDLDGDGVDDLVVGALSVEPAGGSGQNNTGSMTLLSGADGSQIWNVYGPSYAPTGLACSVGHRLSPVGDQNGDTLVDFVATGSKTTTLDGQGATVICPMQLYSGADGSVLGEIAQPPSFSPYDLPVATPGDTNGDQVPELAIAYPYLTSTISQQGAVKLFDGATGSLLKTWWGTSSTQGFGYALVPAGDMDGDGIGDLLIGAKSFPVLAGGYGIARAVSGKTYQVLHEVPAPSTPTIEPHGFSLTLAGLGDFDGDGRSEFAVGAPGFETATGQEEFGRITVYSSAKPPLLGSPAWIPGYPGGTQSLKLDLGAAHAGELFLVGGSIAGYSPPTPLQGFAVPLVIDGYTVAGLSGGSLVSSIVGVLDVNGVGAKQIGIPPLLGQVLLSVYGTTFWHAAITLDGSGGVTAVTNAVPLTITL